MSSAVELIERAGRAGSVRELFAAASARLRGLVPHDAAVWMATDPATILPTAPTRAENLGEFGGRDACVRLWELEFLVEDVNLYNDLAHADRPAASLQAATNGLPERSTRYREFLWPHGYGDELRGVLRVHGNAWAAVTLFRSEGLFDAAETELIASLSEPLGEAVRDHAQPAPPGAPPPDRGPGLMVFDATGELVSMNDDALAWLDELAGDIGGDDRFGVRLPMTVLSTLMRARAIGDTALVIEPAAPAEIAPLVTQAYDLTLRERQITELIARGHGTGEIAARLHLSAHTVRDYVKAIFEKAGVSSRGELVATLFAEHYAPLHLDPNGLDAVQDDLADRVEGSASRGRVR